MESLTLPIFAFFIRNLFISLVYLLCDIEIIIFYRLYAPPSSQELAEAQRHEQLIGQLK